MGIDQFKAIPVCPLSKRLLSTFLQLCACSFVLCMHASSKAQTKNSYPMLMSLKPNAALIGSATEHELSARYNLAGASMVIVSGEGVTGEILPNDQEKPDDRTRNDIMASKCRIRFTVSSDAIPGVRDFRVFTPHGVSTLGQLVVARDPIAIESIDDNGSRDRAQQISLPATICGTIEKAEDVDWYRFQVDARSEWIFHVRAQRLLNRMHDMQTRIDPLIILRNATGATIASNDNFYAGDPLLHHTFGEGGEYFLGVRDVRYQGNADWTYSIEAHNRPFIKQVVPPVVSMESPNTLAAVGCNLPSSPTIQLPPATASPGISWFTSSFESRPTNEFAALVTHLPVVREEKPTVSAEVAVENSNGLGTATNTTLFAIPSIVTGTIAEAGECDRYLFKAKAQEKISFQVFSRRLLSDMDPLVRILNEEGKSLTEADDATVHRMTQADPWLENWTVPADGMYILEIQDLHQRGGPGFTYAIQAEVAKPYFLLEADTDKTLLTPGMGGVVYVRAIRKNGFAGEIQLDVSNLPDGVTAIAGRILPELNDGIIYLEAAANASPGAKNISFSGRSIDESGSTNSATLVSPATVLQEYYSPGGGRGHYPVEMHSVSVAEPLDIRNIRLSTHEIQLKPGESKRIDVEIERAPDFNGNVTLDMIYQHLEQPFGSSLPKGVKVDVANSKTLLTNGDTKGHITLKASDDAPKVHEQLVPVNVHISINFVMKHTFCIRPVKVSVLRD